MGASSFGLAFLAGLLSILSPCVLPLLPVVFASAGAESRVGPAALAAGVALSYVAVGLFVATIGFAVGLDGDTFRMVGAILLVVVGMVLALPPLQLRLAASGGPLADWADQRISAIGDRGLAGQFGIGILLGAVWSPCVGPTLGAASILAAEGRSLGMVAAVMAAFGLGAALPLAAVGLLSRRAMGHWRDGVLKAGSFAKTALGALLVLAGLAIFSGADRALESWLTDASPAWLTTLTTRF